MVRALKSNEKFEAIDWEAKPGVPLAPWTYKNPEFFELDYEAFFLRRWQFVGHVNDVPEVGDFITHSIGRDNVFIIRGKDEELRAFQNVCRHRASQVLEGEGTCKGRHPLPLSRLDLPVGWQPHGDSSGRALPRCR